MISAGRDSSPDSKRALAALCETYWYPLYAYVRRRVPDVNEAQDLTQSFFTRIVETHGLASADPERGRFRSYLLGAMKHFLANEWHRTRARKRGGGLTIIDLDALDPATRYALEPAEPADPDAGFDRKWALEIIARALSRLSAEMKDRGKGEMFEALKDNLTGEETERSQTAARLGMTEGALKTAVHRLRQRYRRFLLAEIAETVSDPEDIDMEMRHLVTALRQQ